MQVTFTQYAYADLRYSSLEEIASGERCPLLSAEQPGEGGYFESQGYAYIGKATVTLELESNDSIVANQIAALNTQLAAVRAESQQQENAILLQISKLQALTLDASQ